MFINQIIFAQNKYNFDICVVHKLSHNENTINEENNVQYPSKISKNDT